MRSLAKLPVRSKFNVLLGVIALGLAGCAAIGLYATSDLATAALDVQAWDVERLGLWGAIDTTMLQLRRHEKDFMLRSVEQDDFYRTGRSPYLDLHAEKLRALRGRVKEVKDLYARFGRENLIDFERFSSSIDAYESTFHRYTKAYLDRGMLDLGAMGESRRAEHELEKLLESKPELAFAVAVCRGHEKDYYLHHDLKSRDRFEEDMAKVRSAVQAIAGAPALLERYSQAFAQVVAIDGALGRTENEGFEGELRKAIHDFEGVVNGEIERVYKDRAATSDRIRDTRQRLMTLAAAVCLGILAAVVLLGRAIASGIRGAVESLRARVGKLREGDLDVVFPAVAPDSNDDIELLDADVSQLAQVLRSFIAASQTTSSTIDSTVGELQRALTELASGYQQQSTAVSQTVTTLDELRSSAVSGNDRAREVLEQAKQVNEIARKGSSAVDAVTDGMRTIRTQVEQIATSVLDLSERAQRIGEIVDSVSAIADQSKLLALNASIEAAKAGEYGHGFAVVAEEVRSLAERSQSATREIAAILKEIQKATNAAVMATEDGSKSVARGLDLVETSRSTIQTLSGTIQSSSRAVEQITYSVSQQTAGVTQINEAMNGILSAVQQGTAESSRIKETIGDVAGRVGELQKVVSRFRGATS
jgi:methyl-accepting chemotaxis protein